MSCVLEALTNVEQEQKARLSQLSKILNVAGNNKTKRDYEKTNKTMSNKTMTVVAKTLLDMAMAWRVSEELSEGNLETICGEVIHDEVQLWNRKQVTRVKLSDGGKNMTMMNLETWKHNKEPENKMIKT